MYYGLVSCPCLSTPCHVVMYPNQGMLPRAFLTVASLPTLPYRAFSISGFPMVASLPSLLRRWLPHRDFSLSLLYRWLPHYGFLTEPSLLVASLPMLPYRAVFIGGFPTDASLPSFLYQWLPHGRFPTEPSPTVASP